MPLNPLRIACAQPAPKSRFAVCGLAWRKIKIKVKITVRTDSYRLIVPTLRVVMQRWALGAPPKMSELAQERIKPKARLQAFEHSHLWNPDSAPVVALGGYDSRERGRE